MVSNLVTIATNYFLSLKLVSILWFSCSVYQVYGLVKSTSVFRMQTCSQCLVNEFQMDRHPMCQTQWPKVSLWEFSSSSGEWQTKLALERSLGSDSEEYLGIKE